MERARERERRIGGAPAWLLVHAVVGREGPGAACTCARGEGCPRPGKHPVARLFPHGAKDAVRLEEALGMMGPGHRLAAVLQPLERVLDADTPEGAASLHRLAAEWLGRSRQSSSPRGFHVWQHLGEAREDAAGARRESLRGGDVKASGYVIWPDGLQRRWVDLAPLLARRFPGVPPGGALLLERPRRAWSEPRDGGAVDTGAVERIASWLERQPEGNRNNALNWAGWRLRGTPGARERLAAAAASLGLGESESARTLRSAMDGGGTSGGDG